MPLTLSVASTVGMRRRIVTAGGALARGCPTLDRAARIAYPLPDAAPLPPRRDRARLPRALRDAALGPLDARGPARGRDLRLHDDAAAHPGAGEARVDRGRLRPARRHVPAREIQRLQG